MLQRNSTDKIGTKLFDLPGEVINLIYQADIPRRYNQESKDIQRNIGSGFS